MAYTDIDDSSAYFQVKTYAGTGNAQGITLDGNSDLQPDWVWFKNRLLIQIMPCLILLEVQQ